MTDIRVKGIDVSHWQGLVNWEQAKRNGAKFMFAKASQWVIDPMFKENWKNAKAVGLPRGAYHYLDWGLSELTQAKIFCDAMDGDWGELPPVCDFEMDPKPFGLSAAVANGKLWNFVTQVEKLTHKIPMIYTGYYYWNDWGSTGINWARFPLWLPWYASELYIHLRTLTNTGTGAPKPWKDKDFWQRTDRANGIDYGCQSKQVDESLFKGDEITLAQFCGGSLPPPTPQPVGLKFILKNNANIRSGPSTYYPVVRIEKTGTVITLKSTTVTNTYAQLIDGNWVTFSFLLPV